MAVFTIKILDAQDNVVCCDSAPGFASLAITRLYQPGDRILVESSEKNLHVWLQLDDALGAALVYLTGSVCYTVPFAEKRTNLSPKAFSGTRHYLYVRAPQPEEPRQYRNLSRNVCDQHNLKNLYPHASANVETRGEAVFFASNAIDGVCENRGHGLWPYASWGINRQDDAAITIDFGRPVELDKILVFLRADFPHDNWWTRATLTFSDGAEMTFPLEKDRFAQTLSFAPRRVTWVRLGRLIKADDPSPFPALTQLEAYGRDVEV